MGLFESILRMGTFERSLGVTVPAICDLTPEELDRFISENRSLFERVSRAYLTSFTHHHQVLQDGESKVLTLRIAPEESMKRFLILGIAFIVVVTVLSTFMGEHDPAAIRIFWWIILLCPILLFGLPFLLGRLYLRFCMRKLKHLAWEAGK